MQLSDQVEAEFQNLGAIGRIGPHAALRTSFGVGLRIVDLNTENHARVLGGREDNFTTWSEECAAPETDSCGLSTPFERVQAALTEIKSARAGQRSVRTRSRNSLSSRLLRMVILFTSCWVKRGQAARSFLNTKACQTRRFVVPELVPVLPLCLSQERATDVDTGQDDTRLPRQ